jgi:type I restriction enzyme R subunit
MPKTATNNPTTTNASATLDREYLESLTSQSQALHLCMRLGYTLLTPDEALRMRGGRLSEVLLTDVTRQFLQSRATFEVRGKAHPFSAASIEKGIEILRRIDDTAGLSLANKAKYLQICFSPSIEETVDGVKRGYPMHFVDFERPERNLFHVVPEFSVERTGSTETCRLDLVLFVNGIPFGVIECKRTGLANPIGEAIGQVIKYQRPDHIERLFVYAQLLGACCVTEARYGTVGLGSEFWAAWTKEEDAGVDRAITAAINRPLTQAESASLCDALRVRGRRFEYTMTRGSTVTEQDRMIASVFAPARMLELVRWYTVFDANVRKTARHQQYFCVRAMMNRVREAIGSGTSLSEVGGIVYHTQGSGKTLTAVMMAERILAEVPGARVVLVTDRVDLDDQIYENFRNADISLAQSESGRDLVRHLTERSTRVITTLVHKFMSAVHERPASPLPEPIFVLVDEAHRTQFGHLAARMRQFFGKACFIGFTGTPVSKQGRDVFQIFGPLLHTYTIKDATADGAVVPLVYEGRFIKQEVDASELDKWFKRYTRTLNARQTADLRKKFSELSEVHQSSPRLHVLAYDIVEHFKRTFKGTDLKGQIVVERRQDAVALLELIKLEGGVNAVVVMSEPDAAALQNAQIRAWWDEQLARYRTADEYEKQTIEAFKRSDDVDLVIVVDKLLVGFDAPRNAVLYLAKPLKDHTLLQAIARVNRLSPGKNVGLIIDYQGVLEPLTKAMGEYTNLGGEDYESKDLEGALQTVDQIAEALDEAVAALERFFVGVDPNDVEAVIESFESDERRREFYSKVGEYGLALHAAMASPQFLEQTPEREIEAYRRRLRSMIDLRATLQRRYAEVVSLAEFEPKIRKLLDQHVKAEDVEIVVPEFSLFDKLTFDREVAKAGSAVAKAYTIANRVKKTITEKMDEDEHLFRQFSELVQEAIDDYRSKRISDAEFLNRMQALVEKVRTRTTDEEVPAAVASSSTMRAYWGRIISHERGKTWPTEFAAEMAVKAGMIIESHRKVNWTRDQNTVNQMLLEIGDALYDGCRGAGHSMTLDEAEQIAAAIMVSAKEQCP